MKLKIFILFFAILFISKIDADNCTFTSGQLYRPSQLRACFNLIPLNSTIKANTLTQLNNLAELYSYTTLVKTNLAPYNLQVDLVAGLNNISSTNFASDFDFHSSLNKLFSTLYDAHTVYNPPTPYLSFQICRPYFLKVNQTSSSSVNISTFATFTCYPGNKTTLNQVVNTIEGIPVDQYMNNLGSRGGYYKDPSIRFNSGLRLYSLATFAFTDLPTTDTHTWTFANGSSETYDIWFQATASNTDLASFQSKITTATSKRDVEEVKQKIDPFHFETPSIYEKTISAGYKPSSLPKKRATPSYNVIESSIDSSVIYGLFTASNGSTTYYLKVTTFSTTKTGSSLTAWSNSFLNTSANFMKAVVNANKTRVIIDVRNNGGGYVYLSRLLTSIVVPSWFVSSTDRLNYTKEAVNVPNDVRITNLSTSLIQNVGLGVTGNTNPYNGNSITSTTLTCFLNNPVTFSGRSGDSYTPKFFLNTQASIFTTNIVNSADLDLVVLTDGLCGSACSQFVSKLWSKGKARIVGIGGIPGQPMESSSFAGGAVYKWTQLTTVQSGGKIAQLPTTAATSFNFYEAYINDLNIPREFTRIPCDILIQNWDIYSGSTYDLNQTASDYYDSVFFATFSGSPNVLPSFVPDSSFTCYNPTSNSPTTVSPVTTSPTTNPSTNPSTNPTTSPTTIPSNNPTTSPTTNPSNNPTTSPTSSPSTNTPTRTPSTSFANSMTVSFLLLIFVLISFA